MGATKTEERLERMKSLLESARDIAAKADNENRNLTAEERSEIEAKMAEAAAIKAQHKTEVGLGELAADIEILEGKPKGSTIEQVKADGGLFLRHASTLGRKFMEDERVSAYLKGLAPSGGKINERARIQSPTVGFAGLKAFGYHEGTGRRRGRKNLITGAGDTTGGALVETDFLGFADTEGAYARPLNLLDVVTRGGTDSDTVEFTRENVANITNAAAPVAEATDAGGLASAGHPDAVTDAAGGLKPQSDYELERVSTTVKTIAHWIPATKRALSDAAQVRTLLDNFLEYGLFEELEDQIANGDGVGENFTGILNTAGIQGPVAFNTDIIRTARQALTLVRTVGRAVANAYILNPADAETLDLTVDGQGRYYYNGPTADGSTPLWRRPVIESEAIPAGTGLVGDFRKAVIWDREEAAISASDSHTDFFVRNLVAILAELRAAFGVIRPAAFVTFATTGP